MRLNPSSARWFSRLKGGRAAAQVQLGDRLAQADLLGVEIDFARQGAQVGSAAIMLFGDDLVARAVVAKRLAKRDMDVQ